MYKHLYFYGVGALLVAGNLSASASEPSLEQTLGIRPLAAPPASFDAVNATAAARAAYAIPPAPSRTLAPAAYAAWERVMSLPHHVVGKLITTKLFNGPNRARSVPGRGIQSDSKHGVAAAVYSDNWSGTSIVDPTLPFQFEAIQTSFIVPTAAPAPGICAGPGNPVSLASLWAGFDGNGSSDVLQAGVLAYAACQGNSNNYSVGYAPWIEWYPNTLTEVSAPVVSPGDQVQIHLWNVTSIAAVAYIVDVTTGVSATYALTAPAGTTLKGNSIEWITEAPTLSGTVAPLANFTASAWTGGAAWNYASFTPTYFYAGTTPSSLTSQYQTIDLLDSATNLISSVTVSGAQSLLFQAY